VVTGCNKLTCTIVFSTGNVLSVLMTVDIAVLIAATCSKPSLSDICVWP
jgi:hypothetical protein